MSFPPILQPQPGLPPRSSLNKAHPSPPADTQRTLMDKEELSNSWPSAALRRQLERRHRASAANLSQQADLFHPARRFLEQVPRGITRSYESVIHPRPARAPHPSRTAPQPPFSLCLTPEAVLVIQKRNREKQVAQQQQQRSARTRNLFPSSRGPRNHTALTQSGPLQRSTPDVRELLKISLLNDQHRYDDMEYEEDCWLREGDEGLVRKCTEWLQGVEMAAGRERNLQDKLQTLPHLSTH